MQRGYSLSEKINVATPGQKSRKQSTLSSRIKLGGSAAFRTRTSRGTTGLTSKQQCTQGGKYPLPILDRRQRIRIFDDGEDVTPRSLVHPLYGVLLEKRTAFDAIGHGQSATQTQRPSIATVFSFSSIYTNDDQLLTQTDSLTSSVRPSRRGSIKALDVVEEDESAPSQFHLPRFDSREFTSLDERVIITLKETETFFLFELAQLTEDANTDEGRAVAEENERYKLIMSGGGRKTVSAETQTPHIYTKTRGTFIGRKDRKNRATVVNNWVMYDTYNNDKQIATRVNEESRFKFESEGQSNEERTVVDIPTNAYVDAARITLRILASKCFGEAQKRFTGMLRQDPCDPDLELVYKLDLLWQHVHILTQHRPVSAFRWNPVNASLLAVGYENSMKLKKYETTAEGIVLIWCAKNPTEPDRSYAFDSAVSDLDWSQSRPNLLAVGFYNGVVRVIDVSKKTLTIIHQSDKKTSPYYEPFWQVQWWTVNKKSVNSFYKYEELFTSNQDGRVSYFPTDENFVANEILHVQRIEAKILGVNRVNHCLGTEVPISLSPGALLLRRHPEKPDVYLVGTEEGCILRCSMGHPNSHLESFLAHDGPIYNLEFSPFCSKLLLTCGADWNARIWAEGLYEPLMTFSTKMACVSAAAWSPKNSTIFASAVSNEICIWDIRRKTHRPASVTVVAPEGIRITRLEFTRSGDQLVASDTDGNVYVYALAGMPLPPFDQKRTLIEAVKQSLLTKPRLFRRLEKLGEPFDDKTV